MKMRFITPFYGVKGLRILTLPVLAAQFGQHADVEICDENVEPLDESPVDVVGISLLVYNAPRGFEMARRFREQGAKVILGGTYPTLQPKHCLQHGDAVVVRAVDEQPLTEKSDGLPPLPPMPPAGGDSQLRSE